jgi:cyanate permease
MKQKIFSKKELIIILMIFSVLAFIFFWYELRPYNARKECFKKANQTINSINLPFEEIYNHCLLEKGHKK